MRRLALLLLLLPLLPPASAGAHTAPSPTENNRYARINLLPDMIRVAYTVFFGERPGQAERRRMDRNGDGIIDEGESKAFATALTAEITPYIDVEVDGAPATAKWKIADLGLGTPTTAGGAFSLDLQLTLPIDPQKADHSLWLDDHWPVPDPGETEVRVEESPGVRVQESHLRRNGRGAQLRFTFRGAPTVKGERGVYVTFRVDEDLRRSLAPAPRKPRSRRAWIVVGAAAALLLAAGVIWWLRRKPT